MTNYEQDTLALIPGETPKEKYDFIKHLISGKKTDLEVFVKMNENDTNFGTVTLGICYDFRSMQKVKRGAIIEMAMPEQEMYNISFGNRKPILVLIDMEAFVKIKNQNK